MFIDPTMNPSSALQEERNVSGNGTRARLMFRSAGARRNPEVARSINITSLPDEGKLVRQSC
jgi:hypothetical protein